MLKFLTNCLISFTISLFLLSQSRTRTRKKRKKRQGDQGDKEGGGQFTHDKKYHKADEKAYPWSIIHQLNSRDHQRLFDVVLEHHEAKRRVGRQWKNNHPSLLAEKRRRRRRRRRRRKKKKKKKKKEEEEGRRRRKKKKKDRFNCKIVKNDGVLSVRVHAYFIQSHRLY